MIFEGFSLILQYFFMSFCYLIGSFYRVLAAYHKILSTGALFSRETRLQIPILVVLGPFFETFELFILAQHPNPGN